MFQRKAQPNLDDNHRIIDAKSVWKRYDAGGHKVEALRGIDLVVRRGEVVAVMGPSGCGKTTLLNCLSGLDVIDAGTIKIAGQDLKELTDNQRTDFRARAMGFVFQTYNLLPVLTGVENVELPMLVAGVPSSQARKRAQEAIDLVGVGEWANHRPAEMSGGQRQRFTIARALATKPQIVWADEPTGALDSETSAGIMDLMVELNKQNDQTFVWVTHSEEVGSLAMRLIRMRDGQITSDTITAPDGPDHRGATAARTSVSPDYPTSRELARHD
ncbi:MAG TPA: ABC transporter ATP-binding protein [Candidatus Limnocylindrales bacterium]|nr:ABC transporter ATP-binding protein [Candidatus Limnocylindrales bacterium]